MPNNNYFYPKAEAGKFFSVKDQINSLGFVGQI